MFEPTKMFEAMTAPVGTATTTVGEAALHKEPPDMPGLSVGQDTTLNFKLLTKDLRPEVHALPQSKWF